MPTISYLFALLLLVAQTAGAGVAPAVSRVIYPSDKRQISLNIANTNNYPVVVELWVGSDSENETPDTARAPVLITSPIKQMAPHQVINLKMVSVPMNLPGDRESLFWFNINELPVVKEESRPDQAKMRIALKTMYKFFYRPVGIKVTVPEAARQIRLVRATPNSLEIANPTPYFFTLIRLNFRETNRSQTDDLPMLAPFSRQKITLNSPLGQVKTVEISYLNDGGGESTVRTQL